MKKLLFAICLIALTVGIAYAHSTWVLWMKTHYTFYKSPELNGVEWEIIDAY